MKTFFVLLFLSFSLLTITACSTTTLAYYNTLKLAVQDRTINYTVEEIASSKADLIQVKAGGRDTAVMALAYIDGDYYRWVSADKVIFTIHHGVIVKTEGLNDDILYTGNLQHNPLDINNMLNASWKRKIDVANIGFGLAVNSTWEIEGEVSRTYFDYSFPLVKITETVSFPEYTPFIDSGLSWKNIYLLHKTTKALLASKQKFSPTGDTYEMVYLSRIVREITKHGAEVE